MMGFCAGGLAAAEPLEALTANPIALDFPKAMFF